MGVVEERTGIVSPGAPTGAVVGLYYDAGERDVAVGDVLHSMTRRSSATGSWYRVLELRVQRRGEHIGRLHMECLKIEEEDVESDDTVHPLYWYPRGT